MNTVQNTAEIRWFNTKKIIQYLKYNEANTKKDLADNLNLSFATVSNICNELIQAGILEQNSSSSSNGGRIPGLLSINAGSRYTIGLNLTQANEIEVALVNLKNEVVKVEKIKVHGGEQIHELIKSVYETSQKLMKDANVLNRQILGIGAAAPGIYNNNTGRIVNSINPVFENQPLRDIINKTFELPVCIENETNLLVLAASLYCQKIYDSKDIVYLFLGEGLGTGIISGGKLVTGRMGLGAETNHMPLGYRNYDCYCGNKGCVESELTAAGFLSKYYEFSGRKPGNWDEFVSLVLSADNAAIEVIKENGRLIGKLISVLVNIFGTEVVYIGGILKDLFDCIYPYIMEEAGKRINIGLLSDISVYNSADYEDLIFKGCSELVFTDWKSV